MKALRALYILTVYILGLPFYVIFVIALSIWNAVNCIRHHFDMEDFKDFEMAIFEGIRLGHTKNIYWVKYGKKYMEKYLEEGLA